MRQDFKKTIFKKHNLVFIKKIKFRARLLVLALFSTFISCNEEIYDIKDQHNAVDKNKISLTQFKKETNIGKVEQIVSISATKSISSKTKTQLSDFVIDTLAIKNHISENNKTTYSFRIYPLSAVAKPNEIYNLVYRLVNGNWEKSIFYLLKKEKVAEDHKLFEKIELIYGSTINKIATSKTSSFEMCTIETIIWNCTNTGKCKTTGSCDLCAWCLNSVIRYAACSSGSGSGGGANDPGNTTGSGGGDSDPYSYSPNTYDNPVFDDPDYINRIRTFTVRSNLGDVMRGFFAESVNISFFDQTIQYQIVNNWSPESYVLAQEMRIRKFDAPIIFNSINPFLIKKNIKDTQLDLCTKNVLNKLKITTQSDIATMISRFDPSGSIFNLNMSTGQVIDPNNFAETTKVPGSSTDVKMVFNEDYIKGTNNINPPTDLSVATTMAHEIIHAYLISLLEENITCGAAGICDFPTIYDAYIQKQITKNPYTLPDAHHELIAEKYVNSIAASIQEFHTGQSVGSGFPYQVYLDMAWGGLKDTYIFNKNYPNDPNHKNYKDRVRILARINAEKIGSQYGITAPIGTPCKK